jgi:hypothetical protein
MNIYEVVKKLVGPIEPVGDTSIDNERLDNLTTMTALANQLIIDIDRIRYSYENNHQYSMKKASEVAEKFLDSLGIKE